MKNELMSLKNVGKATYADLQKLGIDSIDALKKSDPDELYIRLQTITQKNMILVCGMCLLQLFTKPKQVSVNHGGNGLRLGKNVKIKESL